MHIYNNLTIKHYHGNTVQYPSQYVYPSLIIVIASPLPHIHQSLFQLFDLPFILQYEYNDAECDAVDRIQPEEDVTKSIVDVAELQLHEYCFDNFWYLNVPMVFFDSVDEYR